MTAMLLKFSQINLKMMDIQKNKEINILFKITLGPFLRGAAQMTNTSIMFETTFHTEFTQGFISLQKLSILTL